MRPSAYFFGFLASDFVIYLVPQFLLFLMIFILNLRDLISHIPMFLASIVIFSFPFISLCYLVSFLFDKQQSAYKYTSMIFFLLYILPTVIQSVLLSDSQAGQTAFEIVFPLVVLNNNIQHILMTQMMSLQANNSTVSASNSTD